MTRTARHDGDGVSGEPEVITLSDDELARLLEQMGGGSFEDPADPAPAQPTAPLGGTPTAVAPTVRRPTPVPSPQPSGPTTTKRPQQGSFGTPSTGSGASLANTGSGSSGAFGTPAGGSGGSLARPGSGSAGTFGTPAGGSGGSVTTTTSRSPRGLSLRDRLSSLPELWGLDLALIAVSIAGVAYILTNLDEILILIANLVYGLLSGAMEIGVVLVGIALLVFFLFGRRRRW